MTDTATLKYVIPAISLGFAVQQDDCGKLRFFTDDIEIVCRDGCWISITDTDGITPYESLLEALQGEAWRVEK